MHNKREAIDELEFRVRWKYRICEMLGRGAYGIVWKGIERMSGRKVAIKKIFGAFQHDMDAQRTLREVIYLDELRNHPHIIKLRHVLNARNNNDVILVFEYMETDLNKAIRLNNLEGDQIQLIMYQVLLGLRYMHNSKLVHRDLKPSNVLLKLNFHAKLADLGLTRSMAQPELEPRTFVRGEKANITVTEDVQSLWYRAPEVLIGSDYYTKQAQSNLAAIDMWSCGCILGELLGGKPMFPGKKEDEQLNLILKFTGRLSSEDLNSIESPFARQMVESAQGPEPFVPTKQCKRRNVFRFLLRMIFRIVKSGQKEKLIRSSVQETDRQLFPHTSEEANDLAMKLLKFSPNKRITVEEALQHPYFSKVM